MDVGCSLKPLSASTMTPQCHSGSPIHQFFKICPPHPSQELQCKGEPICPFTAYQDAKIQTLCIHPIWMRDAVSVTFFSLNRDNPTSSQELQCKGEPICPFTAYQGAKTKTKTLCIHPIWMWDAVSVAFFSLNHDNPTSFGFAHTAIFQKMAPLYVWPQFTIGSLDIKIFASLPLRLLTGRSKK